MDARRFPTKVLNLLGWPSSYDRTMVLSDHAYTWLRGIFNALRTEVSTFANRLAPQSSNLGMDKGFKGATQVLAVTRVQVGG